jgi:hypothetical protein
MPAICSSFAQREPVWYRGQAIKSRLDTETSPSFQKLRILGWCPVCLTRGLGSDVEHTAHARTVVTDLPHRGGGGELGARAPNG